jgi:hypothetical protein
VLAISRRTRRQTAFATWSMSVGIVGGRRRGVGSRKFTREGRVSRRASLTPVGVLGIQRCLPSTSPTNERASRLGPLRGHRMFDVCPGRLVVGRLAHDHGQCGAPKGRRPPKAACPCWSTTLHHVHPVAPPWLSTWLSTGRPEPLGGRQSAPSTREMLVSRLGFEPRTRGLKVPCSAAELPAPARRDATAPYVYRGTSGRPWSTASTRTHAGRALGPRAARNPLAARTGAVVACWCRRR